MSNLYEYMRHPRIDELHARTPLIRLNARVLLPIIIVGQNIQAKASDLRAEDTFKDAEAVLKEAEEIQKHLIAQDAAISTILERVQSLTSGPAAKSQ